MTGVPDESTIMMESDDPDYVNARESARAKEEMHNYLKIVSPLDAINYVPHAAPTPLLFQFARFEQYFNEAAMLRYARAGSEPKLVLWYDTGHGLNDLRPLIDRANWLQRHIGMNTLFAPE